MGLHIDDARPGPSNAGHGLATDAAPAGLRTRLQTVADDIDGLWRDALDSENFDLVTCAAEASHGVHRALLALGDDRFVIGSASGGANDASRLAPADRAAS
jgi:hypothetical protein